MRNADISGVTLWTALVGLGVDQGWTLFLIGAAVVAGFTFLLNMKDRA